jgi:predicted RNA-binding Zn ribbon-like protein
MATPTYQLLAEHPVLDFVNTLDNRFVEGGPQELVTTYADLLSFTRQTGLLDATVIRALAEREQSTKALAIKAIGALRSARELREALASLFYGALTHPQKPPPDMKTLQRHFQRAEQHRELSWERDPDDERGAPRAAWRWGSFNGDLELPVWAIAQSSAELLTSAAVDQVRMCGGDTCRWLFLDTSRNHSRRWCDMKLCGNRMKARRFQSRRG